MDVLPKLRMHNHVVNPLRIRKIGALRYATPVPLAGQASLAHVQSASGIACSADGELIVISDDAALISVLKPSTPEAARAIDLPYAPDGKKVFSKLLGNKQDKLDLESCLVLPDGTFFALGSGSLPVREVFVRWRKGDTCELLSATSLFRNLPNLQGYHGEINVEGCALNENNFVVIQRGNGVGSSNAIARYARADFEAWIDHPERDLIPISTRAIDLGALQAVPITITDVVWHRDRFVFLAVAEGSPNAYDDGPVLGSFIGTANEHFDNVQLHKIEIAEQTQHQPSSEKFEGICWSPAHATFLLVNDADDPNRPAELYAVAESDVTMLLA